MIDIVNGEADDFALLKDGKIVIVGYTSAGTYDDTALARLLPDGSPDPSFGTNGIIIISLVERNEYAIGVAIQSDHKIVIAANGTNAGSGTKDDFLVARFENSVNTVSLPLIIR